MVTNAKKCGFANLLLQVVMPPLSTSMQDYWYEEEFEVAIQPFEIIQLPSASINGSLDSLASQIWKLVVARLPKSVKDHDDFWKLKSAFDDLFFWLMHAIFAKSRSAAIQFNIRTCEDTDVEIVAIVEYIVHAFSNAFENAGDYASQFEKLRNSFCWFILHDKMHFYQSETAEEMIRCMPIHKENIVFFCELLDYIAPFEECMFSVGGDVFSRSVVQKGLKELRDKTQKKMHHYKCLLALIAIVTLKIDSDADTDAITTVHALLSQSAEDAEKMHTRSKNAIHKSFPTAIYLQRCRILRYIGNLSKERGVHLEPCIVTPETVTYTEKFATWVDDDEKR